MCLHLWETWLCFLRMITEIFFGTGLWSDSNHHICSTPGHGLDSCLGSGNNHTVDTWGRPRGHSGGQRMLRMLMDSGKWALHGPFPWPSGTSCSGSPGGGTVKEEPGRYVWTGPVNVSSPRPHGITLHVAGPWFWVSPWCTGQGIYTCWPEWLFGC